MDFPTVDYLTGIGKKRFIAELMPKYPIYVNLLSNEARAVIIGQTYREDPSGHQDVAGRGFVNCRLRRHLRCRAPRSSAR